MMSTRYHHDVRTTLAIDDDCYERLQQQMRRQHISFRAAVNEALRRGLEAQTNPAKKPTFKLRTFSSGPQPGMDFDDIARLLDEIEGPLHR